MSGEFLLDYFDALDRLKNGRPNVVPKGAKICKDAVSIEAGRKKGSIKKSRALYSRLIIAIDAAAAEQDQPKDVQAERLSKAKQTAASLREQLEAAIAREICLLAELYETKKTLARLTGENVLPLRGGAQTSRRQEQSFLCASQLCKDNEHSVQKDGLLKGNNDASSPHHDSDRQP